MKSRFYFLFLFLLGGYFFSVWQGYVLLGYGLLSLSLLFMIFDIFLMLVVDSKVRTSFYFPIFLILTFLMCILFYYNEGRLYSILQLFVVVLMAFYSYCALSRMANRKFTFYFFSIHVFAVFLLWLFFAGFSYGAWVLLELNPNVMAFSVAGSLFLVLACYYTIENGLIEKIVLFFVVISSLLLIWFSAARSTMLLLVLFLFFLIVSRYFKIKYSGVVLSFFVMIPFLLGPLFTFIYVDLFLSAYGRDVNLLVWDITGKSLFTGREQIWSDIFTFLESSPLFGNGYGRSLDVIGYDISAHSFYMTLLYQLGYLGYVFFVIFFFCFLNTLLGGGGRLNHFGFAVMLAVLFQQMFEQFIFQNNLPASAWYWIFLALNFKGFSYETNSPRYG